MLLKESNRSQRSAQIIIFLRGLPGLYLLFLEISSLSILPCLGSGKSYVADLIKVEFVRHISS